MGTYYVTKWALKSGIMKVEGEICSDISPSMLEVRIPGLPTVYFHGNEWHSTRELAEAQVSKMIDAQIKKLRRQLERLEDNKALDKVCHVSDWPSG